ncbi:MAG: PD-(D/E)XK nuclease family protein, partial [Proteobacteria bacterium]|nr:PD-(D/E)XK nuclease family protein [Pseudomonadota bacterium]
WLLASWKQLQAESDAIQPFLLNEQQTQILWEQIIAESSPAAQLLKVPALAELAMSAWGLLKQWHIDFETLQKFTQSEETRIFMSWAQQFEEHCFKNHFIDTASVTNLLIHALSKNELKMPQEIFLIGFDSFTPQLNQLFKTLKNQCKITEFNFSHTAEDITQIGLLDTQIEIIAMAHWAKDLQQSGVSSIACVVPNLHQIRKQVSYLFNETFSGSTQTLFNISGGMVLSDYPIIYTAFKILELLSLEIDILDISHIVRSPFIGEAEQELSQREYFSVMLQEFGEYEISSENLIRQIEQSGCEKLLARLKDFFNHHCSINQAPSQWAEYFSKQLHIVGWPGQRTLNSEEYQTVKHFYDLLEKFSRLDCVLKSISLSEAKHRLFMLASQMLFQPKTDATPIQVLGVLEAAGLEFEHLWVMGCHHEAWPAKADPNPLLPIQLQRQYNMPHASAHRELEFSQQMTHRFCQSASHIIFSYPTQEDDRTLKPSPLIQHFNTVSAKDFTQDLSDQSHELFKLKTLEYVEDNHGPAILNDEIIHGGTSIFKKFAACPFQSFAHIRLGATTLNSIDSGLNALERGINIHELLKLCWTEIKNSEHLNHLTHEELTKIIHAAIETVFQDLKVKRPKTLTARFMEIEKKRLEKLLHRWFDIEKSRPPFEVCDHEQEHTMQMGKLHIRFRLDRLDQTADGSKYIIDYKTGYPNIRDWFGERPEEPQLPLYCIANPEVDGIAFAQVRIDHMNFLGICKEGEVFYELKNIQDMKHAEIAPDWNQQVTVWRNTLEKISNEFVSGKATVDPKDLNKTCQYCELASLCRIHEKIL